MLCNLWSVNNKTVMYLCNINFLLLSLFQTVVAITCFKTVRLKLVCYYIHIPLLAVTKTKTLPCFIGLTVLKLSQIFVTS